MKRADLIVGQDYLVNGSPDWDRPLSYAERWRILDTADRWESAYRSYSYRPSERVTVTVGGTEWSTSAARRDPNRKANGVLAVRLDETTGLARSPQQVEAIQPGQVRLLWSEWEPRVAAMREHDAEVKARRQREQTQAANRLQFAQDRLQAMVPNASLGQASVMRDHPNGVWTIQADALEALLELAATGR